MEHLPPSTLLSNGKYRIIRHIASGGFGCTYEAVHTTLGSRVAIKEFFVKDFCNRDEETSRISVGSRSKVEIVGKLKEKFLEEAKSLASMNHPGIVRVIDVFPDNGTAYYVMDYIDGRSLHDISKQRGPLPEQEALGYIRQAAEALEYVHFCGRLHLDIKPGNLMLDKKGRVYLIDFGASKQFKEDSGANTSTLAGLTKGYASMEQMSGDVSTFTSAADVYSLGATLYRLLTGQTPPDASQVLNDGVPALPPYISPTTANTVRRAMQPRVADRLHTMRDFLNALDGRMVGGSGFPPGGFPPGGGMNHGGVTPPPGALGPGGVTPPPGGGPVIPPVPFPKKKKKSMAWLWILLGVLVVGGIIAIAVASDDSSSSPRPRPDDDEDANGENIEVEVTPDYFRYWDSPYQFMNTYDGNYEYDPITGYVMINGDEKWEVFLAVNSERQFTGVAIKQGGEGRFLDLNGYWTTGSGLQGNIKLTTGESPNQDTMQLKYVDQVSGGDYMLDHYSWTSADSSESMELYLSKDDDWSYTSGRLDNLIPDEVTAE